MVDWAAYTGLGTGNKRAIQMVFFAVRDGLLPSPKKLCCADCGKAAQQYDHRDYNHPLKVDPVCRSCNQLRGPAIPRRGYFAEFFVTEYCEYSSRKRMQQMLALAGIEADLSSVPGRTRFEHWLPFKDALLAWERQ